MSDDTDYKGKYRVLLEQKRARKKRQEYAMTPPYLEICVMLPK